MLADDDLGVPELGMMLATDLVVLDHYDGSAILVANAILPAPAADGAVDPAQVPRRTTTRSAGWTR